MAGTSATSISVLICDDDPLLFETVRLSLGAPFEVRSTKTSRHALQIVKTEAVDVLLLDIHLQDPGEGLRKIPEFLGHDPNLAIVMLSGLSSFESVREAMRSGAADYVRKDWIAEDLRLTLERVVAQRAAARAKEQAAFEVATQQQRNILVGSSPAIEHLRRQIERTKNTTANVLITGETGVGKEVVARLLRRERDGELEPFVAVDSATIQSSTAESILFGHEKGAFTGAERLRKGVFEEADGGTVYFDEVSNMPMEIQAKLLRVIQEKEITRLGSARALPLRFRVIAATNVTLDDLVTRGAFKSDLLQRLEVVPIAIPPLRERPEDIPALIEHFRKKDPQARRLEFLPEAIAALERYPWPGNVRELANLIAYLGVMSEGNIISPSQLPVKVQRQATNASLDGSTLPVTTKEEGSFYEKMSQIERQVLSDELHRAHGNVSRMAVKLGIDRSHLYSKLRTHKLDPNAVRHPATPMV